MPKPYPKEFRDDVVAVRKMLRQSTSASVAVAS